MEVATASVGLTTAPSATPVAKPTCGISVDINQPTDNDVTTTSTTDSPEIAGRSRRKSITGSRVEVE